MIALLLASLAFQTAGSPIEQVMIHPFVASDYMCSEHWEGQLAYPGDSLGADCIVMGGPSDESGGYLAPFRTDGAANEDWYGWNQPLLAPFDGQVVRLTENPVVNVPGHLGSPPASIVVFARSDGTHVLYAHIQGAMVKVGDQVVAGQPVAHRQQRLRPFPPHPYRRVAGRNAAADSVRPEGHGADASALTWLQLAGWL
jgi:hypothetical protein